MLGSALVARSRSRRSPWNAHPDSGAAWNWPWALVRGLAWLALLLPGSVADSAELVISAAASLTDVMGELEDLYEKTAHQDLVLNFAATGVLKTQIENGAPCDLFVAANSREPESLFRQGLVEAPGVFATGRLVLAIQAASGRQHGGLTPRVRQVTPADPAGLPLGSGEDGVRSGGGLAPDASGTEPPKRTDLDRNPALPREILRLSRLAMGSPGTVPAGRYALEALRSLGVWGAVEPRIIYAEDVRQVLHYVQTGVVDGGILYETDLLGRAGVQMAFSFPSESHDSIDYTFAVVLGSPNLHPARRFAEFLFSPAARRVLERRGFVPVRSAEAPSPGWIHRDPVGSKTPVVGAEPGQKPGSSETDGVPLSPGIDREPPVSGPAPLTPLWLSLQVALAATLIDLVAGLWLARLLAFRGFRFKLLLETLVDLPLVLPPTVLGFFLLLLLAPTAPVGRFLGAAGAPVVFHLAGAIFCSAIVALPLFVRTARSALEAVPAHYLEVARAFGASERRLFLQVVLPLCRRGIVAGALLCFARALGEFGATLMVAGNLPGRTQTLPLAIYSRVFEGRYAEAWILVSLTLLVSLLAVGLGRALNQEPKET